MTLSSPHALQNYHEYDAGHYAKKGWKTPPGSSIPRPQLLRSSDPTKDQNYYLSAIPEKGLERALFPLGELTKADVRKIAQSAGLPTAQRSESMGICFVGQKQKFNDFLGECLFGSFPFASPRSCRLSIVCSELSGTSSRPDIRARDRIDPRNSQRTVDVHHWSSTSNARVKRTVLRRFKER